MIDKTGISLKRIYTTVFGQAFSLCGQYVAVCDNYGDVTVFNVANTSDGRLQPFFQFQAFDGPAYTLVNSGKFLIVSGTGSIKAYDWSEILNKSSKLSWTLNIPNGNNYDSPEANTLKLSGDDKLFAGCGDSLIHVWDLDSGKLERSLKAHSGYIHDMALSGDRLVSAGEDGCVLVWDTRTYEPQHTLEPWRNDHCSRPGGRFIKCVALENDWIVCGGGPKLSLWHLDSLSCTTILESNGRPNVVEFYDEGIICGGSAGHIEYWHLDGNIRASVPCRAKSIFSICTGGAEGEEKITVAGSGSVIDVFTSVTYPCSSLEVR